MTKTEQLDKLARDGEERLLLARALDKLETAQLLGRLRREDHLGPGD